MSDPDPTQNPLVVWVRGNLLASALAGTVLVVLLVALLVALLEGGEPEIPVTAPPASQPETSETTPSSAGPDVPQVDCRILLTDDEVDEAFFGPDAVGPRGHFTFAQGETCRFEVRDDGRYIQLEPGDPEDFEPDTRIVGASGVTVETVGDDARWFDDGSNVGVLTVGVSLGDTSLIYRVHVGRSDFDASQRLSQATELALTALPRFPGTTPAAPKPLVDLCRLVKDVEAEATLAPFRDAHPATRDEIRVSDNFSGQVDLSEEGTALCNKLILAEIYVEAQQGSLTDFNDGATMDGVAAEVVPGLGDEAVFFPDVPYQGSFTAPHLRSVISVRVSDAVFRIVLAVPDTPPDQQLETLIGLATGALAELPGAPAPEKEVVRFEDDVPETEPLALDDVLLRGVEDGTWTLEEGLVSILEQLATDDGQMSGSLVVAEAQAFVEGNPEDGAEVEARLDQLVPDLEGIPVVPEEVAAPALLVSAIPIAADEPCVPAEGNPCWLIYQLDTFDDLGAEKYRVYQYAPSQWTKADALNAVQALHDAAVKLEAIGEMPPTNIVLRDDSAPYAHLKEGVCWVNLGPSAKSADAAEFRQVMAREVSFCLIVWELFSQIMDSPGNDRWLAWGLANYLSDYIYPTTNLELKSLPQQLALEELATTVPERGWTNWAFFEFLGGFMGPDGIMDMLRSFTPGSDLVEELAATDSVSDLYHGMARTLTDGEILDSSGIKAAYQPQAWELLLTGPKELPMTVPRFGVRRVHLKVNPGEYGCFTTFSQGDVRLSWRAGAPGANGEWQPALPDVLEGESVLLLTAVQPGANFTLDVSDVADNPDCEDDDPEGGTSDIVGPILDLCEAICDPSTYYWGPLNFGN